MGKKREVNSVQREEVVGEISSFGCAYWSDEACGVRRDNTICPYLWRGVEEEFNRGT